MKIRYRNCLLNVACLTLESINKNLKNNKTKNKTMNKSIFMN